MFTSTLCTIKTIYVFLCSGSSSVKNKEVNLFFYFFFIQLKEKR